MSEVLRIQRVSEGDINACLPELARLRIQVFREYPYLYEGSTTYEEKYLQTYVNAPGSVVVLIRDGESVVGASSGLPLIAETPNVIEPFVKEGYDPGRVFYYGESVLLPEYRGRGLGQRFFAEREAHVRELGQFDTACFCAVERPVDHPRRPLNYRPLDQLWDRQGFVKRPELRTTFSWRDLDEAAESPKPMVFWVKKLD
jgi:GNAT superfamily N-acetyltransferase